MVSERTRMAIEAYAWRCARAASLRHDTPEYTALLAAIEAEVEAARRQWYVTRRGNRLDKLALADAYEALRGDDDPPTPDTAAHAGWRP